MKAVKFNSILFVVVLITVTSMACSGDCDDPQDAPAKNNNTTAIQIHRDTLNLN